MKTFSQKISRNNVYQKYSLYDIDRKISRRKRTVELNGETLTLSEILAVGRGSSRVSITQNSGVRERMKICYEKMMEDVRQGVPIYGCNTGYGARASRILTHGTQQEKIHKASEISKGIIHIDVSVGPPFEKEIIRAAMLIRINMLMNGVSAVRLADLEIFQDMLNKNITPIVNKYGGIGASGDLAHNCRVVDAARQIDGIKVWDKNKVKEAKEALKNAGIPQLRIMPKAGLGLVNGDNFSTSLAAHLTYDTLEAMLISIVLSAMVVEVLHGTNREFHPLLSAVRPHAGQDEAARLCRYLLEGSGLAYQEMTGHKPRRKGIKAQDAYSLRGISQYLGPDIEHIKQGLEVIERNANSVSDNPLWVAPEYATEKEEPWQWVSGANFLAMYMVEVMDSMRKTLTHIVKLNDRHLAKLVNPHENNGLPANLSDKKAITQCTYKGVQIQSGMLEVYSSLLSIPVSTFFGVHEEGNQDITSHALTSGILGQENLRLTQYSLAQNLLAVCQAVDLRGGPKKLSERTRPMYEFVRNRVSYAVHEKPLFNDIEALYQTIKNGSLNKVVRKEVLTDYKMYDKKNQ